MPPNGRRRRSRRGRNRDPAAWHLHQLPRRSHGQPRRVHPIRRNPFLHKRVAVLQASDVTLNTGRITHALCDTNAAPDNTNRVRIVAANIAIFSNAQINADAMGFRGGPGIGGAYTNGQGPGGATHGASGNGTAGAGYGGRGGDSYYSGTPGASYGTADAPSLPGSGGAGKDAVGFGGNGGGAIRLEAANSLTVNGIISANGGNGYGAGSGGSVWISCLSISGTSGVISADGGRGSAPRAGEGAAARAAVFYDPDAQAGVAQRPP